MTQRFRLTLGIDLSTFLELEEPCLASSLRRMRQARLFKFIRQQRSQKAADLRQSRRNNAGRAGFTERWVLARDSSPNFVKLASVGVSAIQSGAGHTVPSSPTMQLWQPYASVTVRQHQLCSFLPISSTSSFYTQKWPLVTRRAKPARSVLSVDGESRIRASAFSNITLDDNCLRELLIFF